MDYLDVLEALKGMDEERLLAVNSAILDILRDQRETKRVMAKSNFRVGDEVICITSGKPSKYDEMVGVIMKKNPKRAKIQILKKDEDNTTLFSTAGIYRETFTLTCPYTMMALHTIVRNEDENESE